MPKLIHIRNAAVTLGVASILLSGSTAAVAAPGAPVPDDTAGAADAAPGLVINEIETDGTPDWVELYNAGDADLDASSFVVRDRENGVEKVIPEGTTVPAGGVYLLEGDDVFKFKKNDRLSLFSTDETLLDAYEWGDFHLSTWGRVPNGTGDFVQLAEKTPGALNPSGAAEEPGEEPGEEPQPETQPWQNIRLNEVTSANDDPYHDAYELFNSGEVDIDVAAWLQSDSGSTPAPLDAPNGTIVPAGGTLVLLSNQGLSSDGDSVKLFLADGTTLVDAVSWNQMDAQPGSWSFCTIDGVDGWAHTEYDSWGEANDESCASRIIDPHDPAGEVDCQTEPPSDLGEALAGGVAWPGSQDWRVADELCQFNSAVSGQDVSGLDIDPNAPDVMWAVKNKSHVYRLVKQGELWVKDTANDWAEGKSLVFPSGEGQPDTEGITVGADGFLYMTTERDNLNKKVALESVLRYDPSEAGTVLHPTAQWVVTSDFADVIDPANGDDSNLGFEAITWVPDAFLVEHGFVDQNTGEAYDPADYPGHGTGLYFLGLEKNGHLYAYALGEGGSSAERVATVDSGMPRIADAQWDADAQRLWAVADDSVGGSATLLELGASGEFAVDRVFDRPTGLANLNLEGFAIAPDATCVDGVKEVVRSDDGNNGGHSLWTGTIACDFLAGGAGGGGAGAGAGADGGADGAGAVGGGSAADPAPVLNDAAPGAASTAKTGALASTGSDAATPALLTGGAVLLLLAGAAALTARRRRA
ncbi:lamin tail domain-containing protein [Leucobacter sp. USHLN153]|uniref:lamin tail domain-containing protein n=1 Tax=Leucobacter sp. USHLN153 TaxID=3081268 RepID=UPI0030194BD1